MTEQQRLNASVILSVGSTMEARRKILVCAIMTAIDESNLYNVAHGDVAGPDSLGLFQQRASWGSKEDRLDPATSARLFFKAAISADAADPTLFYWDLCHTVQRNADAHVYDLYKTEAERIVSAFGIPGGHQAVSSFVANNSWPGASEAGDFLFYRGNPSPSDDWRRSNKGKRWAPEDSWTCILRNADDVNWRAFFAPSISSSNRAMTFYYIGDDELFKSIPIMTINEFSEGIDGIDFDYDNNKRHADVTITARCGRWYAAPGAVVILQGLGPVVGRWLVTAFDRSLFDLTATITLRKPRPRLPEPTSDGIARADTPGGSWGSIPTNPDDAPNFSQFPFDPNIPNGTRQKVVATALRALAIEGQSHYNYSHPGSPGGRPYPNSLWSNDAHGNQAENKGLDCSSFVTLVFKEAGADDPNGYGYNGTGYTGSLLAHAHLFGEIRSAPLPGDLIFYGDNQENVSHVAVYVGSGEAVGIGSEAGIKKLPWNYRAVVAIGSYFPVEESR